MRNQKMWIKIGSCAVALLLAITGVAAAAIGATDAGKNTPDISAATEKSDKGAQTPIEKNETVYVLAGADGAVKKVIVSDWIKNNRAAKEITDRTDLSELQNVKGDESYVLNADHATVWNAEGKDLYYQGTIQKELPVDLKLTYRLNGEAISPEKLAGKSGKVSIRIDYTNRQFSEVLIDGKTEKIAVPFVMLSGMLLDGERFTNVQVSNGRLINDGDRIAVVGFALPGLQENLKIGRDKLELPDYVEITADVKEFALSTVMTLATNSLFNEIDTSKLNDLDNLGKQAEELSGAMTKLIDGSSALYGGLTQLLAKSGELIAGIDRLGQGADTLATGTKALSEGLKTLVSKNDDLNGGARQVFDALLGTVSAELAENGVSCEKLTAENYRQVLGELLTAPSEAQKAQLIAIAGHELDEKLKAANVPESYFTAVKKLLFDRLQAGETQEDAMREISAQLQNAGVVSAVAGNTAIAPDAAVFSALTGAGLDQQTAGLLAKLCTYLSGANQHQPIENLDTAKAMAADATAVRAAASDPHAAEKINALCLQVSLTALKPTVEQAIAQLDGYQTFYQGLLAYTNGVQQAYDGSAQVSAGADQLAAGAKELKNGSAALVGGVQQLSDGSKKLADGLKEFNEKGIRKLTELAGGELAGAVTRLKATIDVSKAYQNFAGMPEGAAGSVKFIYKTDEIAVK